MILNMKKLALLSVLALVTASCYGRQWKVLNATDEVLTITLKSTLIGKGQKQKKVVQPGKQRNFNWTKGQIGACINEHDIRVQGPGMEKSVKAKYKPATKSSRKESGLNTCGNEKIKIEGGKGKYSFNRKTFKKGVRGAG